MKKRSGEIEELKKFGADLFELLKEIPEFDKSPYLSLHTSGDHQLEPEVLKHLWSSIERTLDEIPVVFRFAIRQRSVRENLRELCYLSDKVQKICKFLYFGQEVLDRVELDFKNRCKNDFEITKFAGPVRYLKSATSNFVTSEWAWQQALHLGFSSVYGLVPPDWVLTQVRQHSTNNEVLTEYESKKTAVSIHKKFRENRSEGAPEWKGRRGEIVCLANFLFGAGEVTVGEIRYKSGSENEI